MTAGIKRTVFWLVVLGLLAAGIGWSLRPRPVPVDMVPASLESLVVTVDADGQLYVNYGDNQDKPIQSDLLMARVSAVLTPTCFRPRDPSRRKRLTGCGNTSCTVSPSSVGAA